MRVNEFALSRLPSGAMVKFCSAATMVLGSVRYSRACERNGSGVFAGVLANQGVTM